MEIDKTLFGTLLKQLRTKRKISLRKLAEKIGISGSYLSEVENSRKAPMTDSNLSKVIEVLALSKDEAWQLNDAAASWDGSVAPDIAAYINRMKTAQLAIRVAEECNATEEDFEEFIKQLKAKHGSGD